MSLRPGDVVEHFVIVSPLGEGGMGQVYVARDTRLERRVALKIVHPETEAASGAGSGASSGAARLLREARAAAALEHANVVTIYEVGQIRSEGEVGGLPFIAMELVKGRPLRAFVGDPSVPQGERVRWLVDVARALAAAHAVGIVHRDVKPENVIVRDDGVVKVLDFGIAKRAVPAISEQATTPAGDPALTQTQEGVAVGTPYYMAPEQMRREVLDGRADQFSWGVVAYELFSGKPVWGRAADPLEFVSRLLTEPPPPLAEACPDVPPHVATAVMRALSKRREDRFASMSELVAALETGDTAFAPTLPKIALPAEAKGPRQASDASSADSPPQVPRARRGVLAAVLGIAIALGASVLVATSARTARAPAPAPLASAAPAPDAGFHDVGSTVSSIPEAAAAYREGVKALRDADLERAEHAFYRALELDRSFAAAHLRIAALHVPFDNASREQATAAVRLKEQLGPHDQTLLDALAPLLEVPENLGEAIARLRRARDAAPDDADLALTLCKALQATEKVDEARSACERARDLDPGAAAPLLETGIAQARLDQVAAALASFAACLELSPLGSSCLSTLWTLQSFEAKCDDALATARRIALLHPEEASSHYTLALALAGAGQPLESVQLALAKELEQMPPRAAAVQKLRDTAFFDLLTGDFAGAEAQLRAWDEAVSKSPYEGDHMIVTAARVQLAEEEGKTATAVALLKTYLARRPAWDLAGEDDYSMFFVGELYREGAMPRAEFAAARDRWIAGEKARGTVRRYPWVDGYAIPARTDADALEAVQVLPGYALPDRLDLAPEWEGPIGRVLLRAGRLDEATAHLSRAAHSCAIFEAPFEQMAATLDLGAAYEAADNPSAACDAYRSVLGRWGRAPLSLTAGKARVRAAALGCAAPARAR